MKSNVPSSKPSQTFSESSPPIDLKTYFQTQGYMVGRPVQIAVTPDEQHILFLRANPPEDTLHLYEFEVATKTTRELLSAKELLAGAEEQFSPEERALRERLRLHSKGITSFFLSPDGEIVLVPLSGRIFLIQRKTKKISELPRGSSQAFDARFSPNGRYVAYVRHRNLFVYEIQTQQETQLTYSQDPKISYGLADFIAQEEMKRFAGFFWSPESTHLAVCEVNQHGVEEFHISDPAHPEMSPQIFSYPRTGTQNPVVRLGIISVGGGPITFAIWDRELFPYVATVRWQKNSPLTVVVQTRNQKCVQILTVDSHTGRTTKIHEEMDDAWWNLDQAVPHWLSDGNTFLWSTERQGVPELELRDKGGSFLRTIAPKKLSYQELLFVKDDAEYIVVAASKEPTERHLYRISLITSEVEPLSQTQGFHHGTFGTTGKVWIHTQSTLTSLPHHLVRTQEGLLVGELASLAKEPPLPLHIELTTASEQKFRVAIVRPRKFETSQKYPVIIDVYGGPCHLHVLASARRFLLNQWLADQGFVVIAIDGRGTPGRGRDWERAILGNFGHIPLEDQVTALQSLFRKYPELDQTRVGIQGWSFGGYLAALAILRRPDVFHAAVAGAPVVDWRDYDTHYTERYLGTPVENRHGYDESSLLSYASTLSRPLLLMHGTGDDNVYFFNSLKLCQALFAAGRPYEFHPLVGATHMISDPVQNQRRWEATVSFFLKNL